MFCKYFPTYVKLYRAYLNGRIVIRNSKGHGLFILPNDVLLILFDSTGKDGLFL